MMAFSLIIAWPQQQCGDSFAIAVSGGPEITVKVQPHSTATKVSPGRMM